VSLCVCVYVSVCARVKKPSAAGDRLINLLDLIGQVED